MELNSITDNEEFKLMKQHFYRFFQEEGNNGYYPEKILSILSNQTNRLILNLNDLREYDRSYASEISQNIATKLLNDPVMNIPPFEEAFKEFLSNENDTFDSKNIDCHLGFEGDFGSYHVTPRLLLANLLGKMVCVTGIVTKCSSVRPKVVKSVHFCQKTQQFLSREYRDATSLTGMPTNTVYPTTDENGNLLETEFGLCKYKDYQLIAIQETPETAPLGQLPRSVDVILENDLVDRCKPGDRVNIVGIYRALSTSSTAKNTGTTSGVFRTVLLANNVQLLGKDIGGVSMSAEDMVNMREFSKRTDILDILTRSIAPSIYGHYQIKQALLLLLLSGCEKNLPNGTHLRGDINILLVGDPSTAKSQLLRFISKLSPLCITTTGRGSSGVGLTAAVVRDQETNERRLEAGAMVLADRGIVAIDEFDKMSEIDRVAIHEVMEQQTVTIAKAGIHATLNARSSVLGAANPVYGNYNKRKRPQENIGLPDSLLSRFDLLFIVLDNIDILTDKKISSHVLNMHRFQKPGQEGIPLMHINVNNTTYYNQTKDNNQEQNNNFNNNYEEGGLNKKIFEKYNPLFHESYSDNNEKSDEDKKYLTIDFLKKYIYYCKKKMQPQLTDKSIEVIVEGYVHLRSQQNDRTLPITARTLETLIRLTCAYSKLRLSSDTSEEDAKNALNMLTYALYNEINNHNNNNISGETEKPIDLNIDNNITSEAIPSVHYYNSDNDSEDNYASANDENYKDNNTNHFIESKGIRRSMRKKREIEKNNYNTNNDEDDDNGNKENNNSKVNSKSSTENKKESTFDRVRQALLELKEEIGEEMTTKIVLERVNVINKNNKYEKIKNNQLCKILEKLDAANGVMYDREEKKVHVFF